jgi:hypothetical protein
LQTPWKQGSDLLGRWMGGASPNPAFHRIANAPGELGVGGWEAK